MTLIGPAPQSQDRTCVSGQTCRFEGLRGTHLQDGDRFMALETCGVSSFIPGFGWTGEAVNVLSSGSSVTWGTTAVTAVGGRYSLCWCGQRPALGTLTSVQATDAACGLSTDFKVYVGELTLIGPVQAAAYIATSTAQSWGTLDLQERPKLNPEIGAFQRRECVAGELCKLTGIRGLHISSSDSFMILDTCGQATAIDRLPGTGMPDLVNSEGQADAWNLPQSLQRQQLNMVTLNFTTPLTAAGGQYRICWCSEVADCSTSDQLRVDVGEFVLHGPQLGQSRTCSSSQNCWIQDVLGHSLDIEDRLMILDTCGVAHEGEMNFSDGHGWPMLGLMMAHSLHGVLKDSSGNTISTVPEAIMSKFDFAGLHVTASGGQYRLCWCSGSSDCNDGPESFLQDLGLLQLQGPSPLQQDRTCMSGQMCRLKGIVGESLTQQDLIMVRDTCGLPSTSQASLIDRFPNDGIVNSVATSGQTFTWLQDSSSLFVPISSASGVYRLCWCRPYGLTEVFEGERVSCQFPEHFKTDLGQLTLLGPSPLAQHRTCVSGMPCVVANITGLHLQYGDTLHILDTCGIGTEVSGIPQRGLSLPGLGSGNRFSWGEEPLTTAGGQFRMCWCAAGYLCKLQEHFSVDIGALTLIGPSQQNQVYCASGSPCWGYIVGVHLSPNDQVMVADECGAAVEPWPSPRSRYPEIPGFPEGGRLPLQSYVGETFQFSFSNELITAAGRNCYLGLPWYPII